MRFFLVILFLSSLLNICSAQVYETDSLKVSIITKNDVVVKKDGDLNIAINFTSKVKNRSVLVYEELGLAYKSTLGNYYYELSAYDTLLKTYKDITFVTSPSNPSAGKFRNREELLKFDMRKTKLSPLGERVLTLNILNVVRFTPGKYRIKIYLRSGNNYGYDNHGHVIVNSLFYLESDVIYFEISPQLNFKYKVRIK